MANKLFNILASIVVVAGITALVLPGRNTAGVISASGKAFSDSLKAAQGR